jgi:hypothetical protein
MHPTIRSALAYAHTLIGLPYRWYRAGEEITGDDKFYATDLPPPSAVELKAADKSIVCTGLANLMRRFVGLPVPPADADADVPFPGTTDAWLYYLHTRSILEPFDIDAANAGKYPAGSLLLRNFSSIDTDQGHVAVLIDPFNILHAYAICEYMESSGDQNAGTCNITNVRFSHYYNGHPGYYTHICRAENWLLDDGQKI